MLGWVVGYHGCERNVAESVVLGRSALRASDNPYDWLGRGIYFWENGQHRALEFARWKADRGELVEPAVVGALINPGRCFNLADAEATSQLRDYYIDFLANLSSMGRRIPENRPGRPGAGNDFDLVLRHRDCAVINYAMAALDRDPGSGGIYFQTVRGVFVEGGPAFEGAGVQARSHIQIAVRDPACILHTFIPQ